MEAIGIIISTLIVQSVIQMVFSLCEYERTLDKRVFGFANGGIFGIIYYYILKLTNKNY